MVITPTPTPRPRPRSHASRIRAESRAAELLCLHSRLSRLAASRSRLPTSLPWPGPIFRDSLPLPRWSRILDLLPRILLHHRQLRSRGFLGVSKGFEG
jgi:hypothetical protein